MLGMSKYAQEAVVVSGGVASKCSSVKGAGGLSVRKAV